MYIDPAAGSLVLQVLAAGLISGLAFFARARRVIREFVGKIFRRSAD
jgi:hypothetical protein